LLKARILLKADASTAGEAWSDSRIAAALDTSIDTIARIRQQLVEEGPDAALAHRNNNHTKADWQFTTASARVKLKRLYPAL
jgi:Homeodomain-like domain